MIKGKAKQIGVPTELVSKFVDRISTSSAQLTFFIEKRHDIVLFL